MGQHLGRHDQGWPPFSLNDLRGKLPANGQYARRDLGDINYLVVHHSGTDADSSSEQIARYHIGLDWPGIGYHFVVRWDGTIEQAHDLTVMSYNVASRNAEVVGICCPGDYTSKGPRKPQLDAANALIAWLKTQLPGRTVVGHGEIALPSSPTSCPGTLMQYVQR